MNRKILQCGGITQYTHKEVTENKPDMIIKNIKEKTCTIIDVAIPADKTIMQKKRKRS
jgi:hypothetical protein